MGTEAARPLFGSLLNPLRKKLSALRGKPNFRRFTSGSSSLSSEQRRFWKTNGYLVLPGFYSVAEANAINDFVDSLWRQRKYPGNPLVIDVFIGTPNEKRTHFADAPDEARLEPYKLNDLFLISDLIRDMVIGERIAQILGDLLDGDSLVCNSLTFERGSQQADHVDSFYMPPPVPNKLVASWIALEDVSPDSGPLRYYPGSQKIPGYVFSNGMLKAIPEEMPACREYLRREVEARKISPVVFSGKAGDLFFWDGQLLHGGTPIKNKAVTRKSLVTHYFRACDVDPALVRTIAPGRHYLERAHQATK